MMPINAVGPWVLRSLAGVGGMVFLAQSQVAKLLWPVLFGEYLVRVMLIVTL